jgi:uncharacterized protein YkwD
MLPTGRVWWGTTGEVFTVGHGHPADEAFGPPEDAAYGPPHQGAYGRPDHGAYGPPDHGAYGSPPGGYPPPTGPLRPPRRDLRPPPGGLRPPPPPPPPPGFFPAAPPPPPAAFVRRPGPPPADRPEVRRIVQGRRITGPIPDPRTWASDPSPFAPPAAFERSEAWGDAPDDRHPDGGWDRDTDWSGGYAPTGDRVDDDRFDDRWSDDGAGYDEYPDEYADEDPDEPLDNWDDEPYAEWDDRVPFDDGGFAPVADPVDWRDDSWARADWPRPDADPGFATQAFGPVHPNPGPGSPGDPTAAYDPLAHDVFGAHQPTATGGTRRGRRRVVWISVAALTVAAIAIPAALKAPPSVEPLGIEVLPGDTGGDTSKLRLSGWVDEGPNGEAPAVRIEVDGRTVDQATAAGESRQRWEWRGPRDERGFGFTVDVGPGPHKVCVIAADDGRTVQCADVDVPADGGTGAGTGLTTAPAAAPPGDTTPATPPPADPPADATTSSTTAAPIPPTQPPPPPTTPPVTNAPAPPAPPPPPPPPDTTWQTEMVSAVNAERAKLGLNAVVACGTLNRAAQGYAETMSAARHFDHTGPDGSTMTSRTRAAGYNGRALAENIAQGYTSVTAVMAGWMGSTGHRNNILNPNLTHIGVGKAAGNYWVQNFGAGGTC